MTHDPQRDACNRETLTAHSVDAIICRLPENILLLAGYWPISSAAWILYPREGPTTLIAVESLIDIVPNTAADRLLTYRHGILGTPDPYTSISALLREAVVASNLQRATIGLELSDETVSAGHTGGEVAVPAQKTRATIQQAIPDATVVDATPILDQARRRKTPHEIDQLRRANTIAAFGLEAFRHYCEPGRTEAEVAAQVEAAITARGIGYQGARRVRSWAQLMSGPPSAEAYSLHPATSSRRIEAGDLAVLELGVSVDGFWSDLTRTLVAGGQPADQQTEMYAAVTAAVDAVLQHAHSGMTGHQIDAIARDTIAHRGFAELFFHPTGHGLGFRYHESAPILRPGSTDPVEDGAVTSVEPGLYLPGFGGMRLEQNVVFHPSHLDLLSPFPTALTP
jgi:Xaa-Pro dipeptidase